MTKKSKIAPVNGTIQNTCPSRDHNKNDTQIPKVSVEISKECIINTLRVARPSSSKNDCEFFDGMY